MITNCPSARGARYLSHGWLGQVVGDWNLNGIWSANSGQRFTATLATAVSNSSGGGGDRPNRIADGNLPSGQRTIDHWFNIAAFTAPAQYTFGNAGTGILVGPGYFNVDLGIHRNFPIRERLTLSYRCEMFNAFNRANFGLPNAVNRQCAGRPDQRNDRRAYRPDGAESSFLGTMFSWGPQVRDHPAVDVRPEFGENVSDSGSHHACADARPDHRSIAAGFRVVKVRRNNAHPGA